MVHGGDIALLSNFFYLTATAALEAEHASRSQATEPRELGLVFSLRSDAPVCSLAIWLEGVDR